MRSFAVKVADMYMMYGRHFTTNPDHPEIIRCTLEDALNIASAPEYVAVHPSADPNDVILQGFLDDGRTNQANYRHRQFIEDWANMWVDEGQNVIIRVLGENGFYTNNGFSPSPVPWAKKEFKPKQFRKRGRPYKERGYE